MGNQTTRQAIAPADDISPERAATRRILLCVRERLEAITSDVIRLASAVEQDPDGIMQLEAEMNEYHY